MATVFDSEKWKIQRVYEPQEYAGMTNRVDVADPDLKDHRDVYIAIPTDLFKYAQEVMKVEDPSVLFLYLDHLGDGVCAFGMVDTSTNQYHDLWTYKGLPKWAVQRKEK